MSEPLDLDAIEAKWLPQCGSCDAGLLMGCTHPQEDYRPVILDLVREVTALRAELDAARQRTEKDRPPLDLDAERETQMLPRINRAMVALHASDYAELVPLEYLPSVIAIITDGLGVPALVAEVTALRAELDKAKANECTALCGDVEQERDELRAELDAARAKALAEMREGVTFALDFNAFLAWHWKARGADVYVNVAMFNAFSDYLRAVLNDAA